MKIALVILNWNGEKLLQTFLPKMITNSPEAEIVIVDNASEDNSVAYVETTFPEVTIIKHAKNYGFAKGYNKALAKIKADVFCLINSDIEVTPGWLNPICKHYKNNRMAGIVQPKILDYKNKELFEYAGGAGGYIDKYGYAYCRGRVFDTLEKDNNQYGAAEIGWASGACFFIKSTDYQLLDGLDEDYFAHYEEIDLCWRASNNGVQIDYFPDSIVYHVGGATLNKSNPFKTFLNFRNSLFTLLKNLPRRKILPIIFTRMLLDGLAGLLFLIQGKPMHIFSIVKAHFSFYSNFSLMRSKRSKYQRTNYYQTKSIVWNYYIKGQKTFRE